VSAPRLSVVVITLNEEERIRECLASVAWADEIVVVDAGSEDKTVAIAREFTDHVVIRSWDGYAAQKNFAIDRARGEWILSLDADEQVDAPLRAEIEATVAAPNASDGYRLARRNIMWGRWIRHGRLYPDRQLRLFRRARGRFADRAVHESVTVEGRIGELAAPLLHHSYRDTSDFLRRADRYSTLAAEEWVRDGTPFRATQLVTGPLGRFLSMYVLHRGFLDGWRGFLLAGLYAYYVFIRSAKIWEKTRPQP
jgi:glycosyltransferase involved in cell wall biosynthesis